jgi:hypothetical protein
VFFTVGRADGGARGASNHRRRGYVQARGGRITGLVSVCGGIARGFRVARG